MKKIVFKIIIVLFILSCKPNYKYKIEGQINTSKGKRKAIWYTDTFNFNNETLFYKNTDNSLVKIYPKYKIIKLK